MYKSRPTAHILDGGLTPLGCCEQPLSASKDNIKNGDVLLVEYKIGE